MKLSKHKELLIAASSTIVKSIPLTFILKQAGCAIPEQTQYTHTLLGSALALPM